MSGNKILVVDDDYDVVETVSQILSKEGYPIRKAYSGTECLDTMGKDRNISAVFLDIMMPKVDGYKVAEELREKYDNRVKIFFVSIKPRSEVNMKSADGFIQKPFGVQEVLLMARTINRQKANKTPFGG